MFDRSTWRTHVGKRLDIFARHPQQDVILSGATSLLSHLAICTLEPFLLEFEREPIAAVQALAGIARGPGANLIVKQAPYLRYQSGRLLDLQLRNSPELRADLEAIIVAIDTIHLVRQRLHGSRADWFSTTLTHELNTYPAGEFVHLRRRLRDRWKSFYDIFRELRQRQGSYTQEDLILLYVGLNDSASNVRAEAARRLGEYAWTPPEKLVAKLVHVALHDRDLETRNAAARALGGLRDRIASPYLLDTLHRQLASADKFVRSATALLLAELGDLAGTTDLINKLTMLLSDEDPYTREAAACALGRMGPSAVRPDVMEALTQALQDVNEHVHGAALDSLTQLRELRTVLLQNPGRSPSASTPAPQTRTHPPSSSDTDVNLTGAASSSSRSQSGPSIEKSSSRPSSNASNDLSGPSLRKNPLIEIELGS